MIGRYLVFASDFYDPWGGWGDFILSTDSYDEARAKMRLAVDLRGYENQACRGHIVDTTVPCIIMESENNYADEYKEWPVSQEEGVRPIRGWGYQELPIFWDGDRP